MSRFMNPGKAILKGSFNRVPVRSLLPATPAAPRRPAFRQAHVAAAPINWAPSPPSAPSPVTLLTKAFSTKRMSPVTSKRVRFLLNPQPPSPEPSKLSLLGGRSESRQNRPRPWLLRHRSQRSRESATPATTTRPTTSNPEAWVLRHRSRTPKKAATTTEDSEPRLPSPCKLVRPSVSSRLTLPGLEDRRESRQSRSRPWLLRPRSQRSRESVANPTTVPTSTGRVPQPTSVPAVTCARQATPIIKSILARKGPSKEKLVKGVRFGDESVHVVDRWIVPDRDVYPDGDGRYGRLQGWRVTPLSSPDADGETEKYMSMWGSDHSGFASHFPQKYGYPTPPPCGNQGCAWTSIKDFLRRYNDPSVYYDPEYHSKNIFQVWNAHRERRRKRGEFVL